MDEILKNSANLNIDEFSETYILKPIKIDSVRRSMKFANGVIVAALNVKMKPRHMLKFGIVYFNNGIWNQQEIFTKDRIENHLKYI